MEPERLPPPYYPAHRLTSASQVLLSESPPLEVWWMMNRNTAFPMMAPHLWNILPLEVHLALLYFSHGFLVRLLIKGFSLSAF